MSSEGFAEGLQFFPVGKKKFQFDGQLSGGFPLPVADNDREVDLLTRSIDVPLRIDECIEPGGVAASAADFETGGGDAGSTEREVIEVFSRFGNDHRRAEAGEFFACISNLGNTFGAGSACTQQLVVGAISHDSNTGQGGSRLDGVGKDQYFFLSFFCNKANIGEGDISSVTDPIVFCRTDHDVIDAFELR